MEKKEQDIFANTPSVPLNISFEPIRDMLKKASINDEKVISQILHYVCLLYFRGFTTIRVWVEGDGSWVEVRGHTWEPPFQEWMQFPTEQDKPNIPNPTPMQFEFNLKKMNCVFYLDGRTERSIVENTVAPTPVNAFHCEYHLKKNYVVCSDE